jgi:hypothetical protein
MEPWKSPAETGTNAPQNAFSALEVEVPSDDHGSDEELSDEEMEVEESWKTAQLDQIPSIDPLILNPPPTTNPAPTDENTNPENTIGSADIKDLDGFFDALGFECTPSVPHSDRSLEELQENVGNVWEMSASERRRIHNFWVEQTRYHLGQSYMDEFERLRQQHARKLQECNEGKEEVCWFIYSAILKADVYQVRRSLLHNMDIIGCTTTGPSFHLSIEKLLTVFGII